MDAPKHIAIIMDGNRRWAKSNSLPIRNGHKEGANTLKNIIQASIELGVEYLTVYAFSSENWNRDSDEVNQLTNMLNDYLDNDINELIKKSVFVDIIGNLSKFSDKTVNKIKKIKNLCEGIEKKSIHLTIALSYGAREEIINAVKKILSQEEKLDIETINEFYFSNFLYTNNIPDPDLLIRTGSERRLSNFLLWQVAYSELFFSNKYWPEFSKKDLEKAIIEYNKRERRYGSN